MLNRAAVWRHSRLAWSRSVRHASALTTADSSTSNQLIFPGADADLSGTATKEGTLRWSLRNPQMEYRDIPRSGIKVSRMGFGGDDLGTRPSERSKLFTYAARRRGINVLEVDMDLMHARYDPNSHLYEGSLHDREWEKRSLMRMVQKGWLRRDELVVVAVANFGSTNLSGLLARGGSEAATALPHTRGSLVERSTQVLEWMGLDSFDVVLAHVPAAADEFDEEQMRDVVRELELGLCRERRLCTGWGIACSAFSPVARDEEAEKAGTVPPAQPLAPIFAAAASAAEEGGHAADSHRMVAVRYMASVTNPAPFVPAVVDKEGAEWSTSEMLERLSIAQFVESPFDSVREGRIFRAVDCEDHSEQGHGEVTKKLEEALNYAVHLELMYDREVAEEGAKELRALRKEWEERRDEALANELASLPESARDDDPGESTTERRERIRRQLRKLSSEERAAEAKRVARLVREAERRREQEAEATAAARLTPQQAALSRPIASASEAARSRNLQPHMKAARTATTTEGFLAALAGARYEGLPGQSPTMGIGHAASTLRPGVTPLEAPPPPEVPLPEDVSWGRVVATNLYRLDSLAEFHYFWSRRVDPAMFRVVKAMGATSACKEWAKGYQATMMTLRHALTQFMELKHAPRARTAAQMLDSALPEAAPPEDWMGAKSWATDALHERVMRILAGTPAQVILTEIPEVYGVRRPGSFGRVRGKDDPILPPVEDRVPMHRIKEALKDADTAVLLRTVVPDLVEPPTKEELQKTLDKGGPEAEELWSRLSESARALFVHPSREELAEKMAEQNEEERIRAAAEARGGTVLDAERT